MNYRNRGLIITVRTLLGIVFVFSGVGGLLTGSDVSNIPEPMATITTSLWTAGFFQMIKITELVAGLMLLVGFLPALAAIILAPVGIGIIVVNAMLMPSFLVVAVIISLLLAYLGYAYWDKYRALFERD
ncbi:DoxX family membrane protein [Patescibacteria group bacterium]|nr:DoxX family membrane protein [Patescibacteria group bacterium]